MKVRSVFYHEDETNKHLFFHCRFARSIWSLIQVASTLYPPTSVANILEVGYMVLILGLGGLLGWEHWLLFDRFGYVEMIKKLIIKIMLSCRLFTNVHVFSVYDHIFSG
jgi:hypothetical protein